MLLEPDLLRTFVHFVETGSLTQAAALVGRSPSAVTAQMQKLEDIVGEKLFAPVGRGRALTAAGQQFEGHARRVLEANREAWLALKGARADGRIVIGATQDFCEDVLPELLRTFARTHPRVRLDLRVGRSHDLSKSLDEGTIDVVIAMRHAATADEIGVFSEAMVWLGRKDIAYEAKEELPLALLDAPCGFRTAAIEMLESVKRPYRIAATSASLSGVRVAVNSGIAVSLRTRRWLGQATTDVSQKLALPHGKKAIFALRLRKHSDVAARNFADMASEKLNVREPTRLSIMK
jgi:DNA-binding transcriptional LysR family regulator